MMRTILIVMVIIVCGLACLFATIQAEERFVDNGDGTLTDTQTGLMWAKESSPGDLSWQDAETYCRMPAIANYAYTDWRMPTIEELRTLYSADADGYETICGLKAKTDPLFELTCTWIWTSDLPETPQFSKREKARKVRSVMAYVFDLGRGYQYADRMVHKKNLRALPVRGTMKETQ